MKRYDSMPPSRAGGTEKPTFSTERRLRLRRLTVRRRVERPGPDRRQRERRQSVAGLVF